MCEVCNSARIEAERAYAYLSPGQRQTAVMEMVELAREAVHCPWATRRCATLEAVAPIEVQRVGDEVI